MALVFHKNYIPENDMPIFSCPVPGTRSFSCLVSFPGGSLVEGKGGLAHLAEHMPFQGNSYYQHNIDIAKAAEDLGAHINASTTHTEVSFFVQGHGEKASEMMQLLARCLENPSFREGDISKEKEVVIEEIKSCQQAPSFHLTQKTIEALYGNHPLARPVVGSEESVLSIKKEDIVRFRDNFWDPSKGGLFLAGDLSYIEESVAQDAFSSLAARGADIPYQPLPEQPQELFLLEEDEEQTDARLIWRLSDEPLARKQRAALAVYSTIIGGTMSSQLFQEMRERRGLCYQASASGISSAHGSGLVLSFALAPEKVEEAVTLAKDIVLSKRISEEELNRAKNYLASDWALSLESSFRVASSIASWYLVYGEENSPDEIIEEIKSIDLPYLLDCLQLIQGSPKVVLRGPHGENSLNL